MCGNFDGNEENDFMSEDKQKITDFDKYGDQFLVGNCPAYLQTMNDEECSPRAKFIS